MARSTQFVSSEALSRELAVSGETIRRDLVALEQRGILTRVHGGATYSQPTTSSELPFNRRQHQATAAKAHIAKAAAGLVSNGQTIMIDIGTTAVAVARALPHRLKATVVTNSLVVASELADRPGLDVLVCGGRVRAGDLALSNTTATDFFDTVYPDIAFLGSGGLHAEAGLTDYHPDEIGVRKVVLHNARRSYALVDAGKFDRIASNRVTGLAQLTGVVVDTEPTGDLRRALHDAHTEIVAPDRA